MSGSIRTVASCLSGYWDFNRMSILDRSSRSYLSSFLGIAASTDDPLAISSPALRTITSMAKFGAFAAAPPAAVGTLSSSIVMLIKTAVMSKKTTRTVRISIIGVRLMICIISVSKSDGFSFLLLLRYRLNMLGSCRIDARHKWGFFKLALGEIGD